MSEWAQESCGGAVVVAEAAADEAAADEGIAGDGDYEEAGDGVAEAADDVVEDAGPSDADAVTWSLLTDVVAAADVADDDGGEMLEPMLS